MGKKLKFMHTADTHIGYNGNASLHNEFSELKVNISTETGENIRTVDVNNAFAQAIDIAISETVDFAIHSGDGTNQNGYKNPRHYNFYMNEVERFIKNGGHWIEIAGNHNFSKKAGIGNELFKLGKMPNVITSYKGKYEMYDIPGTDVVVHNLPSSYSSEYFKKEMKKIKKIDGKFNILNTHCGVTSIHHYAKNESSIVVHIDELLALEMDYYALGDYHYFTDLGNNIIYPGPIERFAFGQEKKPRVLIVEIDTETKEVKYESKYLNVRPMIDLPVIDATERELIDIHSEIISSFKKNNLENAIVRMTIENLPKNLKHKHLFLTDEIRTYIDKALFFKFEFKNKVDLTESLISGVVSEDAEILSVEEGLIEFIKSLPEDPNYSTETLLMLSSGYLEEENEENDNN